MKVLIIVTIFLIILLLVEVDTTIVLAYGLNSSSQTTPQGVNLPQVTLDGVFNLFKNITNYFNNTFSSGQLPGIPDLASRPILGGLNLGPSGGVLNQVVGIVTKIIQVFINLVILFVRQIFLLAPKQQ